MTEKQMEKGTSKIQKTRPMLIFVKGKLIFLREGKREKKESGKVEGRERRRKREMEK